MPELTKAQTDRAARGCAGKIPHRTAEIAQMVADIGNVKQSILHTPIGQYECPVCGMFHVGHINTDGYDANGKIVPIPLKGERNG